MAESLEHMQAQAQPRHHTDLSEFGGLLLEASGLEVHKHLLLFYQVSYTL